MARCAASLMLALVGAALLPSPAAAWYCRANASDKHWGWASYVDRRQSATEALRECARRSGMPLSCRVQNCVPD